MGVTVGVFDSLPISLPLCVHLLLCYSLLSNAVHEVCLFPNKQYRTLYFALDVAHFQTLQLSISHPSSCPGAA